MMIELRQKQDLEELLQRSQTDPVLVFKHSTQCSISSEVYEEFQRFTQVAGNVACGIVLVIEDRAISNEIASRLGVRHESPQAILVEHGRPVWSASHWSITEGALREALKK
jgi:bacillithiol system protein YtxJ